jgi:sporulation protein YhbH
VGILVHDDWSLDRRGQRAQARHREKVKQSIRDNLADVISHQDIILSDGKRTVRIPVQELDEPHFRYDYGKQQHVGQGAGEKGQAIGKATPAPGASGAGAGESPGERILEAEVTLEDIEDVLFADLRLPNLKDKPQAKTVVTDSIEFTDIRNKGIRANIDRKRTFLEALRRSRSAHKPFQITEDDLRFKTWQETVIPDTGAVVIAMMDVSGSMGSTEKYMARTFFFWMEKFLRKQYANVEMRYIVHHTEAYETTRDAFYKTRESGGTVCSTAFEAAKDMIASAYPPTLWNIYVIYVGDGDNLWSDNERTTTLIRELCDVSSMIGYLEVSPYNRLTTLSRAVATLDLPELRWTSVTDSRQILKALRLFFNGEGVAKS